MKYFKILLLLGIFLMFSCNTDDDHCQNPIDKLPAATQNAKQTFGCLINGEVFLPDNFGSGRPSAFYQYVDGKYFLGINSHNSRDTLKGISIFADDILIEEGNTYEFSVEDGDLPTFFADYTIRGGLGAYYETKSYTTGHIFISKFDPENFIISGTFEYTARERNSDKIVKITDGRFDMLYTN